MLKRDVRSSRDPQASSGRPVASRPSLSSDYQFDGQDYDETPAPVMRNLQTGTTQSAALRGRRISFGGALKTNASKPLPITPIPGQRESSQPGSILYHGGPRQPVGAARRKPKSTGGAFSTARSGSDKLGLNDKENQSPESMSRRPGLRQRLLE